MTEKVPGILKKKYGYDVANFSYTEVHICESLDALLRVFGPKKKDDNPIKLFKDGKMTDEGVMGNTAHLVVSILIGVECPVDGFAAVEDEVVVQTHIVLHTRDGGADNFSAVLFRYFGHLFNRVAVGDLVGSLACLFVGVGAGKDRNGVKHILAFEYGF